MRYNQVSIKIERFGKYVPEKYPGEIQRINVYCDDYESVYTALSKAYAMAINELGQYESIGCRANVYSNEFADGDHKTMHGSIPELRNKYEDDVNLEYYDTDVELAEFRLWVYEHADEIFKVIRECDSEDEIKVKLKKRFLLNDYQIRKLSQMRIDMLSKSEYENTKDILELRKADKNSDEHKKRYNHLKVRQLENEIFKLKAYFIMAENYEEIVGIMVKAESSEDMKKQLESKFGINRFQADVFRYYCLNDFSTWEREKKEKELKRLEEHLEYYKEEGRK